MHNAPAAAAGTGVDHAHPYDALTPDVVLDALARAGFQGDGRLQPLNSFENRVYQVGLDVGPSVVAKFYRPARWSEAQILEEHRFAQALVDAEVPMVAPLALGGDWAGSGQTLGHWQGFAFAVCPWQGGRQPELDDEDTLIWIGRLLARMHNVGEAQPFVSRPALDVHSFGWEPMQWLLSHDQVAAEVRGEWEVVVRSALENIATHAYFEGAKGQKCLINSLRTHGDCHPGNILWTPLDAQGAGTPGPHFVDLDDARTAPAVQDFWMLLSGERRERSLHLSLLLEGYESLRPFDRRELALIEPLRTLRLIHYSAWLARRWGDPTFGRHFPWFGTPDYWRGQLNALQDQLEALQEDPLVV
jgi:Ser/Thr protein kinase RdoA (MazF antagonist)